MKKILSLVIFSMTLCISVYAQNYEELNITEIENGSHLERCANQHDSIRINQDTSCQNNASWFVCDYINNIIFFEGTANHVTITPEMGNTIQIDYLDCHISKWFKIYFLDFDDIPEPWTQDYIWKRPDESVTLEAYAQNVNNEWSTGATGSYITITEPGTYWVHMYNQCGELWDTIQVRNNVEIESASVDPDSNKNLVTWETTPEQAEYISQVTIARDGVDMATVPYTDGQYLDNIGSDLAARVYTLRGVCPDGTQCPFPSRRRGTIHMAFLPDINGNVEMTWNQPILDGAPIHINRFEICEYDPNTNEISVIDFVSSVTTSYSCNLSMFDYGYPLIRAIVQDGRGERDILSNRTNEIVGQPQEITINLKPGWTWISYPYAVVKSFASALGDFVPMEGDIIKSQMGNSSYHNGQWRGNVQQFIPGLGYMYFSTRTTPTTLVFDLSSSRR